MASLTPTELHAAVHAAVTARLELARTADAIQRALLAAGHEPGPNLPQLLKLWPEFVTFYDAVNPAAVIRACEADLERLGTHRLCGCGQAHDTTCIWCHDEYPCREVVRIAGVYGVDLAT